VITNTVIALALMRPFAHVGIAFATAASAWLNAAALAVVLRRRGYLAVDAQLLRRVPRAVVASAVMAAALWAVLAPLGPWLAGGTMARFTALAALVVLGLVVFGVAALLMGAADRADLRRLLGRS
jgi:putative peptidoglycan lipid II flippase